MHVLRGKYHVLVHDPMNTNSIRGGAKAQAFGALFENLFLNSCRKNGIVTTRFPDGCKSIGQNRIIRVKTPFDWILSFNGKTALIDTKTTDSDSFSHSKIIIHQVTEMSAHQRAGTIAGYVIWFRKSNRVIFMNALDLFELSLKPGSIKKDEYKSKIIGIDSNFDMRLVFI